MVTSLCLSIQDIPEKPYLCNSFKTPQLDIQKRFSHCKINKYNIILNSSFNFLNLFDKDRYKRSKFRKSNTTFFDNSEDHTRFNISSLDQSSTSRSAHWQSYHLILAQKTIIDYPRFINIRDYGLLYYYTALGFDTINLGLIQSQRGLKGAASLGGSASFTDELYLSCALHNF